jgi:hypothetical protein
MALAVTKLMLGYMTATNMQQVAIVETGSTQQKYMINKAVSSVFIA